MSSQYKVNVPAGPIWDQADAEVKAPLVAAAHQGTWTGQWSTVVPGEMSVVEVELPAGQTGSNSFMTDVLAGPLWSNEEAQKIGPTIAASYGGTFTGQWRTITEGLMSVIQVKFAY